jgi:hypothetical protein
MQNPPPPQAHSGERRPLTDVPCEELEDATMDRLGGGEAAERSQSTLFAPRASE